MWVCIAILTGIDKNVLKNMEKIDFFMYCDVLSSVDMVQVYAFI